jgi:hypothetical protein
VQKLGSPGSNKITDENILSLSQFYKTVDTLQKWHKACHAKGDVGVHHGLQDFLSSATSSFLKMKWKRKLISI